MIGAPTVILERIPGGHELDLAMDEFDHLHGREVEATMPIEAGGINSTIPLVLAARTGLPLVDADGMGRAFPEVQMVTLGAGGATAWPLTLADEVGERPSASSTARTTPSAERTAPTRWSGMGGSAVVAHYAVTAEHVQPWAVPHSVSLAVAIGRALRDVAEPAGTRPIAAIAAICGAPRLFTGKVVDVQRRTTAGFVRGTADPQGARRRRRPDRRGRLPEREPDRARRGRGAGRGARPHQPGRRRQRPAAHHRDDAVRRCACTWSASRRAGLVATRGAAARGAPCLRLRHGAASAGGPAVTLRIGIDVGGTNTDAVLLARGRTVVASVKRPTTTDIGRACRAHSRPCWRGGPARPSQQAMLGTTQCTNAIVQRRGLRRVGVLRIGAPATTAVPPLAGWPADLREAVLADARVDRAAGTTSTAGRSPPSTSTAVRRAAQDWRGAVEAVAVSAACSRPATREHEDAAAALLRRAPGRADLPQLTRSARSACSSGRTPRSSTRR